MNRPFAKAHEIASRHRVASGARKLFALKNDAAGQPLSADLYIYEVIGEDFWTGGGVTAKKVVDALTACSGVKTLNIFINSEGGDVFEAKAIFANLRRFSAEKVVHIDGIAASAATFIAMAGDKIVTAPAATWMVHEAWSLAMGRSSDMRAMAAVLDIENLALAETYAARTGGTVEEMQALMSAETWMSAQEALDKGFTDEIATEETDTAAPATAAASRSPLLAAAAQTQERIRGAMGDLLAARAKALRTPNRSGQPEKQRNSGTPRSATHPASPKETNE